MEKQLRQQIHDLLLREVVLATGCTEPGAVALCVAKACSLLACEPRHINLRLSKNVFKNAMGVGIPGTGMIGLPIAVAMAVVHGNPDRGLEILMLQPHQVDHAKRWLSDHPAAINIGIKETDDRLYIECTVSNGQKSATAIIAHRHTNFIHLSIDGTEMPLGSNQCPSAIQPDTQTHNQPSLSTQLVYDYATTAPLEELEFIRQTVHYNTAASQWGLKGCGLHTGELLLRHAHGDPIHTLVARTVAASDARMDGCPLAVYSNSGSGNQGICCTLPPYYYATLHSCSDEQITRALILNHLLSIYIKQGIGRLSALCGIVNASIANAAAFVYLAGGNYRQICFAIKNMINTLSGMICDGAKPSCALKMASGVYSAYVSSLLATENHVVDPTDGLSEDCVDCSIRNLGRLGREGMCSTDDCILDIMTHKGSVE